MKFKQSCSWLTIPTVLWCTVQILSYLRLSQDKFVTRTDTFIGKLWNRTTTLWILFIFIFIFQKWVNCNATYSNASLLGLLSLHSILDETISFKPTVDIVDCRSIKSMARLASSFRFFDYVTPYHNMWPKVCVALGLVTKENIQFHFGECYISFFFLCQRRRFQILRKCLCD
jgi:hypothetical protein